MHIAFIYLKIWLSEVKCYVTFLHKKRLKRNHRQEFFKFTFLPAELERGTKVLQFDVCCKAIDQNFDCGCVHCAIWRLDSLLYFVVSVQHDMNQSVRVIKLQV